MCTVHSAQCMCKAGSIVFEYVRRRRLNCREPKAEVKIYRYNKTLAATDNHRPFPSHDIGDALESTMDHATEIDISKVFKSKRYNKCYNKRYKRYNKTLAETDRRDTGDDDADKQHQQEPKYSEQTPKRTKSIQKYIKLPTTKNAVICGGSGTT